MNDKRIFLSPPWVGAAERAAVDAAFASNYVAPCGPQVDEFERQLAQLAGRRHAVAVSGGTAALDLLMAEYGVDSTWTILAPTLTFIATVGPAFHRGAKLVFIDCDKTGNIDCALLEEALSRGCGAKPRPLGAPHLLVLGVDLYGRCCDYARLTAICAHYGVPLLLDAAEAVGAHCGEAPSGSAGQAAVYSFNGNKIITTSGGGAIVTDDEALAARARKRSQQSREPALWYEHQEVGYNYRLSNISGAIGLGQLQQLPEILRRRRVTWEWYRERVPLLLPYVPGENHWLNVMDCGSITRRDALIAAAAASNIEVRPVWKPMHLQPVFRAAPVFGGAVAEDLFARGLCLPSGTGLTEDDFARLERFLTR